MEPKIAQNAVLKDAQETTSRIRLFYDFFRPRRKSENEAPAYTRASFSPFGEVPGSIIFLAFFENRKK